MPEEENHINFTAADIEKYHRHQLSAQEMHALEKAALDDPFLADALEGYAVKGVNAQADINLLKKRLAERMKVAKVVPLITGRRGNFFWLRIAAMIILIASAGLLVYQFVFNKKSENIAQTVLKKQEGIISADSGLVTGPSTTTENKLVTIQPGKEQKEKPASLNSKTVSGIVTDKMSGSGAIRPDSTIGQMDTRAKINSPPATAPAKTEDENKELAIMTENNANKKAGAVTREDDKTKVKDDKKTAYEDEVMDQPKGEVLAKTSGAPATSSRVQDQQQYNFFRGRVTDLNNNPVPFANITNTHDNGATYTDAKGYFNFVSPDTVLDVQVRSIGFENGNAQLRNNIANNKVVLQDARRSLSEVIVSNNKPNSTARSRQVNMKLEEPEPADGWDNYDTYLINNLTVPQEIITKKMAGKVEVSFEVDKKGVPVNLKVEKSLCDKCDREAIRLVKEGPKWKRKAKKGRTSVTVAFHAVNGE